ncbi:MAG: glycosyltransferase [Bacteroidota bacterium]
MARKKVLIITYYWPPGGGAGVQRWLKFVKYLSKFGWDPIVYTPSNGEMPVVDHSLERDVPDGLTVIRKPIWEPYQLYKIFIGAKKTEKINTGFLTEKKRPGLAQRLSVWLRGNIFIPDARCFWIRPSVSFLSKWIKENPIDAIVSSGPPHSMHLIAQQLASKTKLPWLADFRDPWTNIDYYKQLKLSAWADTRHHQLEKSVVTGANRVVVVGSGMRDEFLHNHGVDSVVITNGYDASDFPEIPVASNSRFIVSHVGTLVPSRNPSQLWIALGELVKENREFKNFFRLRLTGKVDVSVVDAINSNGLDSHVEYVEYLPHDKVAGELASSALLLLILNDTPNSKGILTGKLFEYLAAKKPVLCLGPTDGDAAKVLKETGAGFAAEFHDKHEIKKVLVDFFSKFQSGTLQVSNQSVEQYSREQLTRKLVSVLDDMTK